MYTDLILTITVVIVGIVILYTWVSILSYGHNDNCDDDLD